MPELADRTAELRKLADDWERYEIIRDPEWRAEMRRALIVEMKVVIAALEQACEVEVKS